MRAVEAVIEIPATAAAVWGVLTDFPRYPEWATYIQRLEGRAEPDTWLRLVVGWPEQRPYKVRVPVVTATPGVRLAWASTMPGMSWLPRAVFSGVHEFVLDALPGGGTRLTQRETFSGLVSHLSKEGALGADAGFSAFNAALRRRVMALADNSEGEAGQA